MDQNPVCLWEMELSEPLPETLDMGAPFCLSLAVSGQPGLDLAGVPYQVMQVDTVICEGVFPSTVRIDPNSDDFDPRNGPVDLRDRLTLWLRAPPSIGDFCWRLVVPGWVRGAEEYTPTELCFSFTTGMHQTSLAVWDVPSPVEINARFRFKVGAKCSACCPLHGHIVEVYDETGAVVARSGLGHADWAEAEGLCWADLVVNAPATLGMATFTIAFPADEHETAAHRSASTSFSVMLVEQACHAASIVVVEKCVGAPVADVHVRLGFHRAATDAQGAVAFRVAPGEHRLVLWKAGYAVPEQLITIGDDMCLIVEAEALPPKDPYERWRA